VRAGGIMRLYLRSNDNLKIFIVFIAP
jgi:hypothetical protein